MLNVHEKLHETSDCFSDMLYNKLRLSNNDVAYSNLCVPADLGEDIDDYITHIHIGRIED